MATASQCPQAMGTGRRRPPAYGVAGGRRGCEGQLMRVEPMTYEHSRVKSRAPGLGEARGVKNVDRRVQRSRSSELEIIH
ncbi:unnamed protein product [Dovyalis caffra]|uniref:Uncharacterized protein n=1 Tax=Dovyalis caffra TaxID=77055 RepID=A0AAV1REJ5_9ROSI|nr:unnamed protein product [Dovyalis caffra]